jgi:hypothetical protein
MILAIACNAGYYYFPTDALNNSMQGS